MLSFRAEMTYQQLGDRLLPPSYIWKSREKYGCEWLMWPQPNKLEEEQLQEFKKNYSEPEEGEMLLEMDSWIYKPSDIVVMLLIPYDLIRLLIKPAKGHVLFDIRPLVASQLFSPRAIRIMLSMIPSADETRVIYPEWLLPTKGGRWKI